MDKIKVKILNPDIIKETKDLMVLGARITQQSHKLISFKKKKKMYNKPYGDTFLKTINNLPHPTLLHFTKINIILNFKCWKQLNIIIKSCQRCIKNTYS